ncbi:hypothetical protein ACE16M_20390 [Escherichia coli]|uniref:hypothetical protein n=1 Tax=Escherichia coli TaxID=562 RepID=UPI001ABBF02A|nr:hypothetical protein [Escherichia coli]EFP2068108.1 hypothetical protein [Escherichia coli]EHC2799866.1 hypothetical protein [Escherichia coli]EIQ0354592.1 hypothetical protein [Escherichia coli]MCJ2737098.1 hypothetical protein [Escherichia coli]
MDKDTTYTSIKITAITLYILFLCFGGVYLKKKKAFEMNAGKLTDQLLFWASLIFPAVGFLAFGIISWIDHSPQLDSKGLNNFLEISKLPLAILSLSGVFGIIVNNIHRTIQTETQIKEAQRKNKMDCFYAHRKNTVEILDKAKFKKIEVSQSQVQLQLHNSYSAYLCFYPNASVENNDFILNEMFISSIEKNFVSIGKQVLEEIDYHDISQICKFWAGLESTLHYLHKNLQLEPINITSTYAYTVKLDNGKIKELRTKFKNIDDLKHAITIYWDTYRILRQMLGNPIPHNLPDKIAYALFYAGDKTDRRIELKLERISQKTDCGYYYLSN